MPPDQKPMGVDAIGGACDQRTVDWNDRRYAEIWRSEWANTINRYFEKNNISERLDLRSFARQGKAELPTVHLGAAVSHMEQKVLPTEIGNYNRQVKAHNSKLAALKNLIAELSAWLKDVAEKLAALTAKESQPPTIMDIINTYFDLRKENRFDWNQYTRQKGTVVDLKQQARIFRWIQEAGVSTLDDFNAVLDAQKPVLDKIRVNKKRIKQLETGIGYIDTCVRIKPIADKSKRGFQSAREKYAEAHKSELAEYHKAVRYLKANSIAPGDSEKLDHEVRMLQKENEELNARLQSANMDTEIIRQIRYCVDTVLHEAKIPEKRKSVLDKLHAHKASAPQEKRPVKQELSI